MDWAAALVRRIREVRLPKLARSVLKRDRLGLGERDPGAESVVSASLAWLSRAQDRSASRDGGVARDFSLIQGWASSYPETTGYIVPTLLECARRFADSDARARARRMLDWLVSIQLPAGAFQGGMVDSEPRVPVTFNTCPVMIGLAAA